MTITSFEFLISFMHRHRWHVRDHAKPRQFEKFRSTRKQYPAKYRPDHETCWCGYHCHFHDGYRRFRRGSFNGKCKAESFSRTFSSYFYLILLFLQKLPALQSFCLYCAVGIFAVFVFQATLFVACVALDLRRIESNRNGLFVCYKHRNHTANNNHDKLNLRRKIFRKIGEIVNSIPGKVNPLTLKSVPRRPFWMIHLLSDIYKVHCMLWYLVS